MENRILDTPAHSSLLSRVKSGDNKAFQGLYTAFSKAMFNISYRIVNNKDEAEDVLQDSFLKAFQNIQKFENENAFGGWLKRVVINSSIDLVRKRKLSFISVEEANIAETEDEEIQYDVESLRACILQLPDNHRIVLSLFLFEDQSHKDIAALLNITEGTSKSHYHRAKKKLVQLIKEKKHEH